MKQGLDTYDNDEIHFVFGQDFQDPEKIMCLFFHSSASGWSEGFAAAPVIFQPGLGTTSTGLGRGRHRPRCIESFAQMEGVFQ
jgi:hypothetical protein